MRLGLAPPLREQVLQDGEGTVTKLTAGLKDTRCRFLGRSEEVSVGVATPPRFLSDLLPLLFNAEGGFRLDPCALALPIGCCRLGVSSLQELVVSLV